MSREATGSLPGTTVASMWQGDLNWTLLRGESSSVIISLCLNIFLLPVPGCLLPLSWKRWLWAKNLYYLWQLIVNRADWEKWLLVWGIFRPSSSLLLANPTAFFFPLNHLSLGLSRCTTEGSSVVDSSPTRGMPFSKRCICRSVRFLACSLLVLFYRFSLANSVRA